MSRQHRRPTTTSWVEDVCAFRVIQHNYRNDSIGQSDEEKRQEGISLSREWTEKEQSSHNSPFSCLSFEGHFMKRQDFHQKKFIIACAKKNNPDVSSVCIYWLLFIRNTTLVVFCARFQTHEFQFFITGFPWLCEVMDAKLSQTADNVCCI